MSTYGLRVKDSAGNIRLDTSDIAARIRYNNVVAAGASSSTTLSDISGKTTYAFSIPLEANKLAHSVSISGTTFSWAAQSVDGEWFKISSSESLVGVIIVD
jgi:hypothetical protein